MEPDILYAVRPGERNESLKLSLRSLANIPHRKVFVAGYCPSWLQNVTVVPLAQRRPKHDNIQNNVYQTLLNAGDQMQESVIYMNDDFYITKPVLEIPVTHGGPIDKYPGKQELRVRMRNTRRLLGEGDWIAYDGVHTPLPLERSKALNALAGIRGSKALWRTWYGNKYSIGGHQVEDTKIRGRAPFTLEELPTFVSTNAGGLTAIREMLEEVIPHGSPYCAA